MYIKCRVHSYIHTLFTHSWASCTSLAGFILVVHWFYIYIYLIMSYSKTITPLERYYHYIVTNVTNDSYLVINWTNWSCYCDLAPNNNSHPPIIGHIRKFWFCTHLLSRWSYVLSISLSISSLSLFSDSVRQ